MPRPLLIPYAIDTEVGVEISADEIASRMSDLRSTVRLQATAYHDTRERRSKRLICPVCAQQVYPHAPTTRDGRYYWAHLPRGASAGECPLEVKRKLTPDQINARIFAGRQEGDAHKDLVALLARLAEQDPNIESIALGVYEPPTDDMRSEFPFGRFPDVQFACGGDKIILEAQLATITLHGINGRRAFYDRRGASLLWVMRNFDPRGPIRASVRDIIADQRGILFSIDNEIVEISEQDEIMRLRAWIYDHGQAEPWKSSILTIAEASALTRPVRWADDFKRRWIEAYQGGYYRAGVPKPHDFFNEAATQALLPPFDAGPAASCFQSLINLLISLEAGVVTGSGHRAVISIANDFDRHDGFRAVTLIHKAVQRWQPHLLERRSMKNALNRARQRLRDSGATEWGRKSAIGKMREVLFPDWILDDSI